MFLTTLACKFLNTGAFANYVQVRGLRKGIKISTLWPGQPKKWKDGQKYFGFTYYPRFKDQKDPEYEPSKLFLLKRRKHYTKYPWWEQKIMSELGLDHKFGHIAIVKNSAHVNAKLWQVKHLITILPITFPNGLPEGEDYAGTYLNEDTGEFIVHKKLKYNPERLEATEKFQSDVKQIDIQTIKKKLRYQYQHAYNHI